MKDTGVAGLWQRNCAGRVTVSFCRGGYKENTYPQNFRTVVHPPQTTASQSPAPDLAAHSYDYDCGVLGDVD